MNRSLFTFAVLGAGLSSMGNSGCGGPITANSYFDLWCGESETELCDWEVETGSVQRTPTWHEGDFGAELVGSEAAISQALDEVPKNACLGIDLLSNQTEDANVQLELDFLDDGVVEYTAPVDGRDWKPIYFRVRTPEWFNGVRVRLKKSGGTRVVLARAQIAIAEDCPSEPIELQNRPRFAPCEAAQQCGSAVCTSTATGRCVGSGLIGLNADGLQTVQARCHTDADCESGQCAPGACFVGQYVLGCFTDEDCGGLAPGCVAPPQEMLCQ